MRYFDYLKKRIIAYIMWGVLAGVLLSISLFIYRYNIHLSEIISQMSGVMANTIKIKEETHKIDSIMRYMHEEFGIDISRYDPDSYLLIILDSMKRDFQNAVFTISSFQNIGNMRSLSLNISTKINSNRRILDYMIYLDSLRLPDFKFSEIKLTRESQGITMDIKGSLILPISQNQGASYG